jgi:hypothetical protein
MTRPPLYDELFKPNLLPYKLKDGVLPSGFVEYPGYGFYDEGSLYVPVRINNMLSQDGAFTVIPPNYIKAALIYSETNVTGSLSMSLVYETGSLTFDGELQDVSDFAGNAVNFTFGTMPVNLDGIFLIRFVMKDDTPEQHAVFCPIHLDWGKQITLGHFVTPPQYEYVRLISAVSDGVITSVKMSKYVHASGLSGTIYTLTGTKQHIPEIGESSLTIEPIFSGSYTTADILVGFYKG